MPYIPPKDRLKFDKYLNKMLKTFNDIYDLLSFIKFLSDKYVNREFLYGKVIIENKGELEYCVFKLMIDYMYNYEEAKYSNLHGIVYRVKSVSSNITNDDAKYAIEHCADEFRRRFLDEREDEAIDINGDMVPESGHPLSKYRYREYTGN